MLRARKKMERGGHEAKFREKQLVKRREDWIFVHVHGPAAQTLTISNGIAFCYALIIIQDK